MFEQYGKENVKSESLGKEKPKNGKLSGDRHLVTKVPFDERGFPIFDNIMLYETRLKGEFRGIGSKKQMKMVTKQLKADIKTGKADGAYV
jgi:filamentous hemagglutinin